MGGGKKGRRFVSGRVCSPYVTHAGERGCAPWWEFASKKKGWEGDGGKEGGARLGGGGARSGRGGDGLLLKKRALSPTPFQHTPAGSAVMTASMLSATDRASKEGESKRKGEGRERGR